MTQEQALLKKYRAKVKGARELLRSVPREGDRRALEDVIASFEAFIRELEAKQCAL